MKTLKMILVIVFCFGLVHFVFAQQDWEIQGPIPHTNNCMYVKAFDENSFIIGTADGIFKSYDGGTTYEFKPIEPIDYILSYFFLNEKTGWASTYKYVWSTVDGGENWKLHSGFGNDVAIYTIFHVDEKTGWAFSKYD